MMREYQIRHLPVQKEGKLVGVLSDRDIKLASSFNHPETLTVEDVMTPEPYAVSPTTPLDQVATTMAVHKYGCAIIQEDSGKVIGIFTSVDASLALSEVLKENYKD